MFDPEIFPVLVALIDDIEKPAEEDEDDVSDDNSSIFDNTSIASE